MPTKITLKRPADGRFQTRLAKRLGLEATRVSVAAAVRLLGLAAEEAHLGPGCASSVENERLSRFIQAVWRLRDQVCRFRMGLRAAIKRLKLSQEAATAAARCEQSMQAIDDLAQALAAAQARHGALGIAVAEQADNHIRVQKELALLDDSLKASAQRRPSWWAEVTDREAWHAWIAGRRETQQKIEEARQHRDDVAAKSRESLSEGVALAHFLADLESAGARQAAALAGCLRARDQASRSADQVGLWRTSAEWAAVDADSLKGHAAELTEIGENLRQIEASLVSLAVASERLRGQRSLAPGLQLQALLISANLEPWSVLH